MAAESKQANDIRKFEETAPTRRAQTCYRRTLLFHNALAVKRKEARLRILRATG